MPRNPTATAPHLCGPTVSFSTGTERAVMNKGAVKATAIASARGMNFKAPEKLQQRQAHENPAQKMRAGPRCLQALPARQPERDGDRHEPETVAQEDDLGRMEAGAAEPFRAGVGNREQRHGNGHRADALAHHIA